MKIDDLALFVEVADQLSFTDAANTLDLPQSTVSRKIKQIEETLQARLFERTSRQIFLTQQGHQFYQHSKAIVDEFRLAQDNLSDFQSAPSGDIHLCMPAFFSEVLSKEFFDIFLRTFPDIRIRIKILSPTQIEQTSDADLFFYLEPPQNSCMVARRLFTFSRRFYAAPSYLDKYGVPSHPSELIHHNCLRFDSRLVDPSCWYYFEGNNIHCVEVEGCFMSESIRSTMQLAAQGHGICYTPQFLTNGMVRDGQLICLFDGKYSFEQPYYVMYHSRHHMPKRVRVFLDMLTQYAEQKYDLFEF
ncbi:LysR family transcriptional regulator [Photobacterium aquae]|uniref:LysR family transcriptional regulator n=1 Tax=Photobacterium aquae TaxID=1195763 RepID=A0A0J1JNP2_9GAMM|nr:LysR family transcriptional regulator [Photobacterium aquae]KLV03847.1 LysR family transcriptional regulator [Photobacterium aquae]